MDDDTKAPAPITEVNGIIRNVNTVGIAELQDRVWAAHDGKVRVHDGIGQVPKRLACSCDPWCGARYFPKVLHLRDLTWHDIERLLRRNYGDYEFDLWAKEIAIQKRLHLLGKKQMVREQGSDPLFPSFLPIPYIVENALNHDFFEYLSAHNPDKKERFRFLRMALAPLVLDQGLAQ